MNEAFQNGDNISINRMPHGITIRYTYPAINGQGDTSYVRHIPQDNTKDMTWWDLADIIDATIVAARREVDRAKN